MFIDSHAHLDAPEFQHDRDEVIARARDAGVELMLNIGAGYVRDTSIETALSLAETYECVYLAFGIHPHDATLYQNGWEEKLLQLSEHPKVLAWGEVGLDYHYNHSPRDVQRAVFRRQLQCARQRGLPVIIHTREAEQDTLSILREQWQGSGLSGILHCFTGTLDLAEACIEMGFYVSFSGILTFKNAADLRAIAQQLPLERLLIETDCPLLAPAPMRGRRNEPSYVRYVARQLAHARQMSEQQIAAVTSANFRRLFGLNTD
ncbi:MAG: TatD family hydrolase [Acidobacteriota bacterium]|nr:TatD family hydrolase [Blastocatellia bacterium]MDW8240386.1 TatD family hydrolase [Acidobacteriota bacterium]